MTMLLRAFPTRVFFLWITPLIWLGGVGTLWLIGEGEKAFYGGFAGTVVSSWLVRSHGSALPFVLAQLLFGTAIIGCLGLVQDCLRLPPWTCIGYFVVAGVLSLVLSSEADSKTSIMLFALSLSVTAAAPVLCLMALIAVVARRLALRDQGSARITL